MQQVLGAFDWSSYELRIEHDVESVNPEVSFGFLMATINLDDIAQALKGVKGEPDGENKSQRANGVVPADCFGNGLDVGGVE